MGKIIPPRTSLGTAGPAPGRRGAPAEKSVAREKIGHGPGAEAPGAQPIFPPRPIFSPALRAARACAGPPTVSGASSGPESS